SPDQALKVLRLLSLCVLSRLCPIPELSHLIRSSCWCAFVDSRGFVLASLSRPPCLLLSETNKKQQDTGEAPSRTGRGITLGSNCLHPGFTAAAALSSVREQAFYRLPPFRQKPTLAVHTHEHTQ
ncbi:unnamed protein product, partial [Scytosiphon promiscuus]